VFCYFDNDVKVRAPVDAHNLMRKLGQPVAVPAAAEQSGFTPGSLDALPFAASTSDARWQFGSRASRTVKPRRRGARR
jgi:hypothetical protein